MAPTVFQLTSFQTINVNQFLKYQKVYMPNILPFEILPERGLMIDLEYEFKMAECLAKEGGAGYLGKALSRKLLAKGYKVRKKA